MALALTKWMDRDRRCPPPGNYGMYPGVDRIGARKVSSVRAHGVDVSERTGSERGVPQAGERRWRHWRQSSAMNGSEIVESDTMGYLTCNMAMVLEALSSYLMNMIAEMTKEEIKTLFGASSEMEKMTVKLGDLKRFLADADRRNITDETVHEWVRELKGAMYDATDIVDLCKLKTAKRGNRLDAGCLNPLLFCMRNPLFAHDIGSRMKKLNQKLEDIKERSATFNFINLGPEVDPRRHSTSLHYSSRETSGELNKLALVGEKIEEATRNLVEMLTKEEAIRENNKNKVFAIVGVGGIGKTTLAQRIFNDDIIEQHFTRKLWLSVNQDFNNIELLRKAVAVAKGDHQALTKTGLESTLKEALKGQKTILVMDDVWDHKAWVDVLETPLTNALAAGSRVLITTRNDMVARRVKAMEPYHHVERLELEDAWSLLKKQVVINEADESQVDMIKDIGMNIVKKCDGLPLAVKVMGGLLLQKRKIRSEWESILNDSIWSISQMPEELNHAIYLSYQDLHPNLKPCFLHFSLLPKSTVFFNDDIIDMWISEGFVHGNSNQLENIANEHYKELIARNLIEPNTKYLDQGVCNMHDVVRYFAQYVARDETLASHNGKMEITDKLNSQKHIRLSLETKGLESNELEWTSLQGQISLRTLISVGHIKINHGDSLSHFSSLRTLHIQDANFNALTKSLVQLIHLRYLSIKNTNTSMLPESIDKLKFLQFISLLDCTNLRKLPGTIIKLQNLRYLNHSMTNIRSIPKGFSSLINLRVLGGFPAYMDGDWCSLEELGKLSELKVLGINILHNISSSLFSQKARLGEKVHLIQLALQCINRIGDTGLLIKDAEDTSDKEREGIEAVFDELCPPACLENLIVHGYFGRQLPRWMMSTLAVPLGSLRILTIENLPFCTELPDSLCQLPCLEVLQIENAPLIKSIGSEFLQPQNNEHSRALENLGSAFKLQVIKCLGLERISNLPKMQELTINHCPNLKVLQGMPALQRLDLEDYKMKTLPGYLRDVNPMYLGVYCDVSLLTSMAAGKSGPEWDKFCHIKQVKVYADDDDNDIENRWYLTYTRDPFSFKTNIDLSTAPAKGTDIEEEQ